MRPFAPQQNDSVIQKLDRRDFLRLSGLSLSGIIIGIQMGCSDKGDPNARFSPNVYLTINGDGSVIIIAHRSEMGTGIRTGLPLIVADELEADWKRVKVEQAVGDESIYGNQNTDGSFSVRMFFEPMRRAGAMARLMLERAAASAWGVPAEECQALNHEVVHSSGKKLGFGDLAEAASKLEVPKDEELSFKTRKDWKLIGKSSDIVDVNDIVRGTAVYGQDVNLPDMKYAVILRCPVAGGKVASFNADKAKQRAGVIKIDQLESKGFPADFSQPLGGIVVIADNSWSALEARNAIEVTWDYGPNALYNTSDYFKDMLTKVKSKGHVRREHGSFYNVKKQAANVLESTYTTAHLSHAPMEPPNAVAHFKDGACEIWAPTQHPQWARDSVAAALDIDVSKVTVHITLLGGGFGRKSKPDYVVEAALISKLAGAPVKLLWSREDDIRNDFFHACSAQHIEVSFDQSRNVTGWCHRSVFPPIGGTASATETEPSAGELQLGMVDFPYDIPNLSCESHEAFAKTRIGWLRSVSNIQHAFAIGSMLDEIAYFRGKDPVENLLELLGDDRDIPFDKLMEGFENYGELIGKFPWSTRRLKNVIRLVSQKAGWGKSLPKGQGMGICAHRSFLTYVACVVSVQVDDSGIIRLGDVHYAVDCGVVVNENSVKNQFEGGAVFAAGLALKGGVTFSKGMTDQTNFDTFRVMRMEESPQNIHVHMVESDERPTGVGEPPVPPFAPALANAIFAATGKRYRDLPIG
jgi:isoquinoline 1-oxidoreductase beta subunit